MIEGARYAHTNLVARDWKRLAEFYETLFGCTPVPPERDYSGAALEAGAGVPGASVRGIHLRFPGHGDSGPTLEIFTYSPQTEALAPVVNRPGFGHIAFEVPSVEQARTEVLLAGGRPVGEVPTLQTATGARVTWFHVGLGLRLARSKSQVASLKWQVSSGERRVASGE